MTGSTPRYEPTMRTKLKTRFGLLTRTWGFAVVTFSSLFWVADIDAQRFDRTFREFHRSKVPTPDELMQSLNFFRENGATPKSKFPLSSAFMKQLQDSGEQLLSNMTPEQRKKAREIAEQFLANRGLESEEGKALMNQLGIPPELQDDLADQVKQWDPEDRKRIADLAQMFGPKNRGSSVRQERQSDNRISNGNSSQISGGGSGRRSTERSSQITGGSASNNSTNRAGRGFDAQALKDSIRKLTQNGGAGNQGTGTARSPDAKQLGNLLQEAARKMGEQGSGPRLSENQTNQLKKMFDGARNTLGQTGANSQQPKERLTSRFDRLLVQAAKRSLESKNDSANLDLPESVESAFENVIGKVQESIKEKKRERLRAERERRTASRRQRTSNRSTQNQQRIVNSNRQNSSGGGSSRSSNSSSSQSINLFESLPELPAFDPKRVLLGMAILGLFVFLGYVIWQVLANRSDRASRSGLKRRPRQARIRSPRDLVDAVDQVIIYNFGNDARWWNAGHAKNVLCAAAPNYSAPISELIREYVRARYSQATTTIDESLQQQYKATLKELANLRMGEGSTVADESTDRPSPLDSAHED